MHEGISKTKLKVTGLKMGKYSILPEPDKLLEMPDIKTIQFKFDIYRTEAFATEKKTNDEIKLKVDFEWRTEDNSVLIAQSMVTTFFETKPLKRKDVDEDFFKYIVDTGYFHAISAINFYSQGTILENKLPSVTNVMEHINVEENIEKIWGDVDWSKMK